jgi:formate dehydrogenase major subunit
MKGSGEISRREFLKFSAILSGGLIMPKSLFTLSGGLKLHKPVGESPTICCFCGVGCGAIVATQDGRVINLEGDPDHPVSQGSLCPKGMAMAQINTVDGAVNPHRLQTVKYRAPGANKWEEKDWDWTLKRIAQRVKETRDQNFIEIDSEGRTVNRLEAIASLGGASLDNEECSLITKAMRSIGLVYYEHQARL